MYTLYTNDIVSLRLLILAAAQSHCSPNAIGFYCTCNGKGAGEWESKRHKKNLTQVHRELVHA